MNLKDIPLGATLLYYSKQFDVSNRIIKLSDDYTGLNRDIAYFRYADRGSRLTPEQFAQKVQQGKEHEMYYHYFALWQWEFDPRYGNKIEIQG